MDDVSARRLDLRFFTGFLSKALSAGNTCFPVPLGCTSIVLGSGALRFKGDNTSAASFSLPSEGKRDSWRASYLTSSPWSSCLPCVERAGRLLEEEPLPYEAAAASVKL